MASKSCLPNTSSQPDRVDTATDKQLRDSLEALHNHEQSDGQPVGITGFSLGAFEALSLLKEIPVQVGALVIFYGTFDTVYPASHAPVLGHFAETDEFEPLSEQKKLEQALGAGGATVFYTYPGTGHWFFEADQSAYNAAAAELAWQRTLEFLNTHLKR